TTRFQERDFWQVAGVERVPEIDQVVLMVRLVRAPDVCYRTALQMMLVPRPLPVLERLMVRNIIALCQSVATSVRSATDRFAVRHRCGPEAALEPSPGDAFRVQQIADVLSVGIHHDLI